MSGIPEIAKTDYAKAVPPHNIEAEQALLGVLLFNNEQYYAVCEIVAADDFYDPLHERLYDAIAKTIDAGRVADVRTLRVMFDNDPALAETHGAQYLIDLVTSVLSTIGAKDYAHHIHELATRRRLLVLAGEVMALAHNHDAPPSSGEALINQVETKLFALAERRNMEGAVDMATACRETIDDIDQGMRRSGIISGITSGLPSLDRMLSGFQEGWLYTIGGRPSMGKTGIGLTLAANAALSGKKVMFFSLEMDRKRITNRLLARLTEIPANRQRANISQEEFNRLFTAQQEIQKWPLSIDDSPSLKVSQIRGRAIRRKRRSGLDMIMIDYLGLLAPSNDRINRNYQIEEVTKGLKALAQELKIPIVLMAQVNREVEKRDDKRPSLADLRDSGSVEQDSDAVMFIYRHEYYLVRGEPQRRPDESEEKFSNRHTRWQGEVDRARGRGELIVAKQRDGETGTVHLRWQGWRCLFTEDGMEGGES